MRGIVFTLLLLMAGCQLPINGGKTTNVLANDGVMAYKRQCIQMAHQIAFKLSDAHLTYLKERDKQYSVQAIESMNDHAQTAAVVGRETRLAASSIKGEVLWGQSFLSEALQTCRDEQTYFDLKIARSNNRKEIGQSLMNHFLPILTSVGAPYLLVKEFLDSNQFGDTNVNSNNTTTTNQTTTTTTETTP